MKLIITDSSVFFDIIKIQALPEFFALDFEICATDFVKCEILESEQREQVELFIRSQKLIVFVLSEEEIEEVENFKTHFFNSFFATANAAPSLLPKCTKQAVKQKSKSGLNLCCVSKFEFCLYI